MSGTMMDNKPLSPSSAEPEPPVTADDAKPICVCVFTGVFAVVSSTASVRRESALRDIFVGPDGTLSGHTLADLPGDGAGRFQVEGWLVASLRSHLSVLWWRMTIEAGMMLAAILPGFVMARIEGRPFGDFGLPARGAFGRNFWVGTLWGIASLSVLMLVLRVDGRV